MLSVLHVDMNAFYASVEALYDPSLRTVPMAVCGDPSLRRGIVLAKNERAKRAGVTTGQTIWQAKRLCPKLVVVPPHYDRYVRLSKLAIQLYRRYSDRIEPFGLDENWLALDVSSRLEAKATAEEIRRAVKTTLGLTVSIGVSDTKPFAKLGSDLKKPDAVTTIWPDEIESKAWPLPASALLGIGPATCRALARFGVMTIGQVARLDPSFLRRKFGLVGLKLWTMANGRDHTPVTTDGEASEALSIGRSTTTPVDVTRLSAFRAVVSTLADEIASELRRHERAALGLAVSWRDSAWLTVTRQTTLSDPTALASDLTQAALTLAKRVLPARMSLRSIGLRATHLVSIHAVPQRLDQDHDRRERVAHTLDALRARYGEAIVTSGLCLLEPEVAARTFRQVHEAHPVGYTIDPTVWRAP